MSNNKVIQNMISHRIKQFIIVLGFLLISMTSHATDSILVFIGEIKILEVGDIKRVAVGNGALLSTSMLENGQLLILAEAAGETTLHIWYSDGAESDIKVQVLNHDQDRLVYELQTLLADLPNVEVKVVGQKIFLSGNLNCITGQEDCEESKTIETVQAVYPDVINLTRVRVQAAPVIIPSGKMVSMSVKITEFNTDKLSKLGINWADAISGPFAGFGGNVVGNQVFGAEAITDGTNLAAVALPTNISTYLGTFGLATGIASAINLLINTGDAILLAEPRLSARSGGTAEFLAGGEIPVVTTSLTGTDVEYKEFGIILNVSPIVDDENNILATIYTEVSAVDLANAVDGVPAFITRKTTTDVSMRDGETLILSGLIDRSVGESIEKFPILGDIPILGALFRSTDWNNELTELVIFVTPTVFDAKSQFNQERIQRRVELIEQFKKHVDRDDYILD